MLKSWMACAVLATTSLGGAAWAQSPPPEPAIASITELSDLAQNPIIMLRDGGVSAKIGDYSYWLFADTQDGYVDANGNAQITYYSDNSLSATKSLHGKKGITLDQDYTDANGNLERFVPWSSEDSAWITAHAGTDCAAGSDCGAQLGIWPQTIAYDEASKVVVVGFNEIKRLGGIVGYPSTGAGLAVGTVGANGWLDLQRDDQGGPADNPTMMWAPGELFFTNAAFIKDGYYYAYAYGAYWNNYLARVPLANLLTKSAWTYYAGQETWSPDVAQAVNVFEGSVGNDVFYDAYLKQWVTIYLGYNNNQVFVRVADLPEGPWSDAEYLTTVPFRYGKDAAYIVHAHPEFSSKGRTIDFTYTISPAPNRQVLPTWAVTFNKPG